MIIFAVVYAALALGIVVSIDRRMHAAQVAREAAFLRSGFGA